MRLLQRSKSGDANPISKPQEPSLNPALPPAVVLGPLSGEGPASPTVATVIA
jgi:hypothetical protein